MTPGGLVIFWSALTQTDRRLSLRSELMLFTFIADVQAAVGFHSLLDCMKRTNTERHTGVTVWWISSIHLKTLRCVYDALCSVYSLSAATLGAAQASQMVWDQVWSLSSESKPNLVEQCSVSMLQICEKTPRKLQLCSNSQLFFVFIQLNLGLFIHISHCNSICFILFQFVLFLFHLVLMSFSLVWNTSNRWKLVKQKSNRFKESN